MAPNRYVQRINGAFVETYAVDVFEGLLGVGQLVALNVSGYVDPSLIYSLAGGVVTSVNSITGGVAISGGLGVQVSTSGNVVTINASGAVVGVIGAEVDGGGVIPVIGLKELIQIPFNCKLIGFSVIGDISGSCSWDIWFIPGASPPIAPAIPTSANKISASAGPSITSAQSNSGGASAISTWTQLVLTQWGTVAFNLASVTSLTKIRVQLWVQKI